MYVHEHVTHMSTYVSACVRARVRARALRRAARARTDKRNTNECAPFFYTKVGAQRAPLCIAFAQSLRLSIGSATIVGRDLLLTAKKCKVLSLHVYHQGPILEIVRELHVPNSRLNPAFRDAKR